MPCYRICKVTSTTDYNNMRELRKWWEEWDLRILVLYMFISQLYLLFFGRLRRKNASPLMTIVSVWLLYLFADLLATIALGKLSKVNVDENDKGDVVGEHALRVMWAPLILFYLGGPDTLTVLRAEENKLWVRHLIGLLTQGIRAAYVLIVTWNTKGLSLLALLVFVPGIMKYAERVWVVKSRSEGNYKGFEHKLDLSTIDKISASQPNAKLVLHAYSWFQTLMPHNPSYKCDSSIVNTLVKKFHESLRDRTVDACEDAFKLIEIELGLIYDLLFSKVGMIFTLWGSILRFLSFSLIVSVLVVFLTCDKPHGYLKGDHPITIILLAGAIFLELAGVVVQFASDWAMVWAYKKKPWGTSILFLHEFLISKRQRWSGVIGQFSYRDFCTKYKPTMCNNTWEYLFGKEKMLKRFSSQSSPVQHLRYLIISHLCEKSKSALHVDTSQTSTKIIADVDTVQTSTEKVADVDKLPTLPVTRGGWTLSNNQLEDQLNWSINRQFDQSIVIWHVATEVCYDSEHPKIGKDNEEIKAVKILSDYMMYMLVACPDRFSFCNKYKKITKDYVDMNKLFGVGGGEREGDANSIAQVNEAQTLVRALAENPKKWKIMGGVWVEMLCYAAKKCPVKNHIQELRHGGEFLTHIWLLLMHFSVTKEMERSGSSLKDEYDGGIKTVSGLGGEIEGDKVDEAKYGDGGIQATSEELDERNVDGWYIG